MTKSPENMSGKDQKTFLAIKQGIRDGITQKELGVYIGQKKSYVGYFLEKYGIKWKEFKAGILLDMAREKSPVMTKKPEKARPKPVVKPVVSAEQDMLENIFPDDIEQGKGKVTDIEFNAEDIYVDPNRPKSNIELSNEMSEYSTTRNESIINNATEITEEFFQALLLEYVKAKHEEGKLQINAITEIRNYLDKTDKLQSEKSDLNPNEDRIAEIEDQAQKVLDGVFEYQMDEVEKKIMAEDLS